MGNTSGQQISTETMMKKYVAHKLYEEKKKLTAAGVQKEIIKDVLAQKVQILQEEFYISSLAKEEFSRFKEGRTHAYKQALRVNRTILLAQQAQVLHTEKEWIYLFSFQNESIDSDDISGDIGVYNGILESTISSNDIEYSSGAKAYLLIQKKMARMGFHMTSPIYEFLNEQPAISLLAAAFFTKETTPEEIIQIITATIQENIDKK